MPVKLSTTISKIESRKGYPIIQQSGQYPEDINVCAQQEYQLNGTTNLHNDCYPIKQNVQKTYWYTIFDYGEVDGFEADSNPITKSNEMEPESNNNTLVSNNNNNIANGAPSKSGIEQVTVETQLKESKNALSGWYDINKFRLAVSDGSEICPSNNCEYSVEDGNFFSLGSSSYTFDGKLKVTIPEDDDASKSTFYDLGLNLDTTGEVETNGETMQTFDGTFSLGPHITYTITNATLEADKKSPVLTIEGERALQNSTSSE